MENDAGPASPASPDPVPASKRKWVDVSEDSRSRAKLDLPSDVLEINPKDTTGSMFEECLDRNSGQEFACETVTNGDEIHAGLVKNIDEATAEVPAERLEPVIQSSKTNPEKFVSSENFKLRITNLPHPINYGEARRLIQDKLRLRARKIKLTVGDARKPSVIFATFVNAKALDAALEAVDGRTHRGLILKANIVNSEDPVPAASVPQAKSPDQHPRNVIETVCPLQSVPYSEQLQSKQIKIQSIVDDIVKGIISANPEFRPKKVSNAQNECSLVPQISLEIPLPVPSPVIEGYRNKCEFTCGYDADMQRTIGYRLTTYKKGCVSVGRIEDVSTVSKTIKSVVKKFEVFLRDSTYTPFDPLTNEGFYRTFTVRTTNAGLVMVILTVSGGMLETQKIVDLRKSICEFYESLLPDDARITSFHLKESEVHGQKERNQPVLLFGSATITETMLGLKFEISPDSFFQVNTSCAELLYKAIIELACLNANTTLLDVCCGTGTIGIACCKLSNVGEVIGIESCESAVVNARKNAAVNNVSDRCQFYTGRAETLVDASINSAKFTDLVAVVDPPRAGLASNVVSILRNCSRIQRIIYVACKLEACKDNLVSFARPQSKKFRGECFVPERIIPVDMFPHTHDVECVIVLKRVKPAPFVKPILPSPMPTQTEAVNPSTGDSA